MTIDENIIKKSTGGYIKNARKEAGLSQKALGEKLGVSQQMIAQYESGKRKPKVETLINIVNALDLPVSSFDEICSTLAEKHDLLKNTTFYNLTLKDAITSETLKKMSDCLELLNKMGQEKAIEQVELLTKIPEYKKDPENQDQE